MPELPDVEVFKRYMDATSSHQKIRSVGVRNEKILGTSPLARCRAP
jgi:formamidopyrimidine-DNA glycosylase